MNWTSLKSRKAALLTILATLLLHLAFAIGTRCHVLEQLITAGIFLFPALPFVFTKVPMAATTACIAMWPFIIKVNDISCLYTGNGYYAGGLPFELFGLAFSLVVGIATFVMGKTRTVD
jgi:hypothetical protein